MTTTFQQKYCDRCDQRTRHKVEKNDETGWRRERCMPCWSEAIEQSKESGEA